MDNPRDGHDQKILLVRKNHKKTINIRKNARAIPSQRARLNFASSVAMMNFEVKSILLFAQDLRQGRACPGAHPRPPGFRRQNLDAHPPGPSKKTKWTPTHPLGECLSNTPTRPAQRKKAKSGYGRPVPEWKTPGRPVTCGVRTLASRPTVILVTTEPLPRVIFR